MALFASRTRASFDMNPARKNSTSLCHTNSPTRGGTSSTAGGRTLLRTPRVEQTTTARHFPGTSVTTANIGACNSSSRKGFAQPPAGGGFFARPPRQVARRGGVPHRHRVVWVRGNGVLGDGVMQNADRPTIHVVGVMGWVNRLLDGTGIGGIRTFGCGRTRLNCTD